MMTLNAGPYETLALIGAGGMGKVYKANDTKLGREVAVNVLPDLFSLDEERLEPTSGTWKESSTMGSHRGVNKNGLGRKHKQ